MTVVALVLNDPLFKIDDAENTDIQPFFEKESLKWASLLHDIAKLSLPNIKGKDHTHPFKSASVVIDVFLELGMIKSPKMEKLNKIKHLLS